MVVTKNRLLRVAVKNMESEEDQARWEGLCGQKGQNAYIFSTEEGIRESVKAYNDLLKALKVCLTDESCMLPVVTSMFMHPPPTYTHGRECAKRGIGARLLEWTRRV